MHPPAHKRWLGAGFVVVIVAFFVAPNILRVQKLTTAAAKIAMSSLTTEQAGSSKAGGSKASGSKVNA